MKRPSLIALTSLPAALIGLAFALLFLLASCSQGAPPPAPVSTVVDTPAPVAPAPVTPAPAPVEPAPAPAAPCRLLAVWDAEGRTHATIGPRCPADEWVMVVNLATGSWGSSVVNGWPAQVTASATAPGLVVVSGGVMRE